MKQLEKIKSMMLSEEMHIKLTLGLLITLGVTLIGGSFAAAAIYTNMQRDIVDNHKATVNIQTDVDINRALIADNKEEIQRQEVIQAQINTKLANIENRQIEMLSIMQRNNQ